MIRERRSKEKLQLYYRRFIEQGIIDPNVHPWVAESWQKSLSIGVPRDSIRSQEKLSRAELNKRREKHRAALDFLEGLFQEIRGHFNNYNLSFLLLDNKCYALKSYALPFFQKSPGEVEGLRLSEADIGTSSIAIAYEHKTPFLVFGPESWIEDGQSGDACSTPVLLDGKLQYILTLVSTETGELPPGAMEALLLTMKYAMENNLSLLSRLEAKHAILDAAPLAAYHILPGGRVAYANNRGQSRLTGDHAAARTNSPNLNEVVLNYQHTPLAKGFYGIPSHYKEVTWITSRKTYEDITSVLPLYQDDEVSSVVAISLSIEDLEMLEAHATGYAARYSLASMVGQSPAFILMKEKARRVARGEYHVVLQGESGTGKQRLAHGIHQASSRAAGPLITVRCGEIPPEYLDSELFGINDQGENEPGKLELASGGTLFLDEVEKLPLFLAEKLAVALASKPDVRIIAASDGDLKRLMEKDKFSVALYELIAKSVIRVPALRARRADIELLAEHIIQELAEQHSMEPKTITPEAIAMFGAFEWPGNIKQLQTVVEEAFYTTGSSIEADMINMPGESGLDNAWKEDREVFLTAWKAARGNISRLSGILGVSRVTLYRYLKKYGLEKE